MIKIAEIFGTYAVLIILGLTFMVMLVTAPCHAVFVLPFVGMPLFWLLPPGYALPINIVIWLATPFLYRAIRGAMKRPPVDGFQSLVGSQAEVVSRLETGHSPRYIVRTQGELWSAYSTDNFEIGEPVAIVALRGIGLVVGRAESGSGSYERDKGTDLSVAGNNHHCH